MAKEELIQFEGLVTEILPDARFRVQLDAGHEIVAYTAGKMKKFRNQDASGRSRHRRDVALRSRKGPPDLPPQGRACRHGSQTAGSQPIPTPLNKVDKRRLSRSARGACKKGSNIDREMNEQIEAA